MIDVLKTQFLNISNYVLIFLINTKVLEVVKLYEQLDL